MKIQDLLNQSKPCWKYAAMSQFKKWYCYTEKPELGWNDLAEQEGFDPYEWVMVDGYQMPCLSDFFDIEPFDGDWKDSLICREECGL